MRRTVLLVLALVLIAGVAFGQAKKAPPGQAKKVASIESLANPGELIATAGVGWGGLSGGAELMLAQVKIADLIPLTFGAGARAFVDPGIFYSSFSTFSFGAGAFGTAHVGFKELKLPDGFRWLSNVDSYVGLGLGFASVSATSYYSSYNISPGIGISTFEGVSYYLNDKLALTAEYGYIGSVKYTYSSFNISTGWPLYYSTFGVTLKL